MCFFFLAYSLILHANHRARETFFGWREINRSAKVSFERRENKHTHTLLAQGLDSSMGAEEWGGGIIDSLAATNVKLAAAGGRRPIDRSRVLVSSPE